MVSAHLPGHGRCSMMTRIDQTDICLPKSSLGARMPKNLRLVTCCQLLHLNRLHKMYKQAKWRWFDLLQMIFGNVDEKSEQGQSLFDQAAGIFSSLNRFMRVISR